MNDNAYNLEFEALATAVHQEVLDNSGINEKTLDLFIISQHELSRSQNEFERMLKDAGAEFDEPLMGRLYRLISNMHPRYRRERINRANASTTVAAAMGGTPAARGTRRRRGAPREATTRNQIPRAPAAPDARPRGAGRRRNAAFEQVSEPQRALVEPTNGPATDAPNHPGPLRNGQRTSNHIPSQPTAREHHRQQVQPRHGPTVSVAPDDHFVLTDAAATTAIEPSRSSARRTANATENPTTQLGGLTEQTIRTSSSARIVELPETPASQPFAHLVNHARSQSYRSAGSYQNGENNREHPHLTNIHGQGAQLGYSRMPPPPPYVVQENTAALRPIVSTTVEQPRSFIELTNDTSDAYSLRYESEPEELESPSSDDLTADEDLSHSATHDPITPTIAPNSNAAPTRAHFAPAASTNSTTPMRSTSTSMEFAQTPEQGGGLFGALTDTIKSMVDSPGTTAMGVAVAAWAAWTVVSGSQGRRGWLR